MQVNRIIQEIDAEITRLQQARVLLLGGSSVAPKKKSVGRPTTAKPTARKRRLSAEGRKRIADAMRKRWAERRKQQGSK